MNEILDSPIITKTKKERNKRFNPDVINHRRLKDIYKESTEDPIAIDISRQTDTR